MHSYINPKVVKDFTKFKTIDAVILDVRDGFKITNIRDDYDESLWYICDALYDDYIKGRSNYEAYIEVGMNARMLMELRKSAVLFEGDDFFAGLGGM